MRQHGLRLAVHADGARYIGLGGQLMQQAETEALAGSSRPAWAYTQFGARGFYWRLGCAVFGELPYYPRGFIRSFLRKRRFTPGSGDLK